MCVLVTFLSLAAPAHAGTIKYWNDAQPTGNARTGVPVIISGHSTADGYPLLPASAKLSIDGVEIPRWRYSASILATSAYFHYSPSPALVDGIHTFRVEVSDSAGKLSLNQWTARIVEPPSASWVSPGWAAAVYTGRPVIVLSLADNTPGTTFSVAGQVRASSSTGPVVATFSGASLPAGASSFGIPAELAPGMYYLTATVTDAAGNSRSLGGSSALPFFAVVAPAMSQLESCDGCHPTLRSAHPTPADVDCQMCHPGYGDDHMQGTEYCEDCHWQGWHNGRSKSAVKISATCVSCHSASRPEIARHTAAATVASHQGSCSGCHDSVLTDVHGVTPAGSSYGYQCDVCHGSTNANVVAAITAGDGTCSACHVSGYHAGFDEKHSAPNEGCAGDGCHPSSSLPDVHAAFVGPGGRYPQYDDTCALCHSNEDAGRIPEGATAACETCHPDFGSGHVSVHDTSTATLVVAGTTSVCGDCHDANLMTEHSKATASSASAGCDACHPAPRSTILTFDKTTCVQAGCHVAGTAAQMHGGALAGHTLPSPAPACLGSQCHAASDAAGIHAAAATGDLEGCMVCHGQASPPTSTACVNCHPGDQSNFHGDISTLHTATVTCVGTCHSARLDTEHANQSLTCDACHKSADPAVRAAIDAGTTTCSACHGPDHAVTSSFCTGCHTTTNGTYAGPTTYAATRHASTATSSVALTQYPGTSYGAGSCANCHGTHSATTRATGNQLCLNCHDGAGTTKPAAYSYQGGTRYASSAHAISSSARACGACHAVHGATNGAGGAVANALRVAEPTACTGSQAQPGCHASSANARNGTNILAKFTANASASAHHDAYATSGLVCSKCHDPHTDTATQPYANPAAIGTGLPSASDRFRDANGMMYVLVGAQHDGVGPVISRYETGALNASDPTKRWVRWYTDELSMGYVDWGTTTAYGNTANSNYSNYTFHYVPTLNFPIGTTWHYRVRTVDQLGNTTTSQDYTYRLPYTEVLSGPTVSGGTGGVPVTVTWTTRGACDTWVDYGATASYGSTSGSSALITVHTVQLPLAPGTYHLRARSSRDIDSFASSDMVVTVYRTGATAPVITPVLSNASITGPVDITFQWTQPDTANAPFTYQLHVWDSSSSPAFDYVSSVLTTNTATVNLDGDHNYSWNVQARDNTGYAYPLSATGTFYLYYYTGGSGSCPFLYTWDGSGYVFESDEFAAGKLGLNTSKGFRKPNPLDYHVLDTQPALKDGALEYKLVEERAEADYLDEAKLYTVEAPADRDIWVERSQAEGVGRFTTLDAVIHTTERVLQPPASVVHVNTGEDVTAKIAAADGDYLMLNEDRNNGYDYQTIELDLGNVQDAPMTKLVIDGRTCIPTSVAGRQRSLLFGPQVKFEVQDADGAWRAVPTTNTILPKPPEFERPFVLDLSNIWISDSRKVRFTYLYKTYFDAILLDTTADVPVTLTELPMVSAELRPHGFDSKSSLSELYEYTYGAIASAPYYYLPGNYTKFGEVTPLLDTIDDKFVIFGGGDELTLRFAAPAELPANTNRRFLFLSDGYYKDLKQTIDHTIDPLPFAAMSNFPYAATEHYPDDAEHQSYLAQWNTRYEDGPASEQTPDTVASVLDTLDRFWHSLVDQVASLFVPEQPTTVAAAEYEDTLYSIDTDKVTMNVVYATSSTPVSPSAGWQSASLESAKPTPAAPGTAVDAATLAKTGSVDSIYWRTDLTSTDRAYNWQLMKFPVPSNLLTGAKGFRLQWDGHGEPTPGYWLKAYLWDFSTSQWVSATEVLSPGTASLTHMERQAGSESFCLTCHRSTPPAGVNVAGLVNINNAWDSDFHGEGISASWTLKAPYVAGNPGISCGVCHDSHGSASLYHFKDTVNGMSGISVVNGNQYQNLCRACHVGTVASFHAQCDSCHYSEHGWGPTIDESWDCSACHRHGYIWVHNNDSCHCGDLPSARSF